MRKYLTLTVLALASIAVECTNTNFLKKNGISYKQHRERAMETLMLSQQYRDYIVGAPQVEQTYGGYQQQRQPTIDPTSLDEKYQKAYYFVSGFLDGATYIDGGICGAALNGMAYYGLKIYEETQKVIPNPIGVTINTQKATEQYAIFFAECNWAQVNQNIAELLQFQDFEPHTRFAGRITSLATVSGMKLKNDFETAVAEGRMEDAGRIVGTVFSQLIDVKL